jgi:hypothetical protein
MSEPQSVAAGSAMATNLLAVLAHLLVNAVQHFFDAYHTTQVAGDVGGNALFRFAEMQNCISPRLSNRERAVVRWTQIIATPPSKSLAVIGVLYSQAPSLTARQQGTTIMDEAGISQDAASLVTSRTCDRRLKSVAGSCANRPGNSLAQCR